MRRWVGWDKAYDDETSIAVDPFWFIDWLVGRYQALRRSCLMKQRAKRRNSTASRDSMMARVGTLLVG